METAIFGLLGVIVGGIITAGSNYLLDRRRERFSNERDSRNLAIEIKRAARLIDAELLRAAAAAAMVIKNKRWSLPDVKLKTDAWQKYSSIIAPVLSYTDWLTVMTGVVAIDDLSLDMISGELSDVMVSHYGPMLEDIDAARRALVPFVSIDSELQK